MATELTMTVGSRVLLNWRKPNLHDSIDYTQSLQLRDSVNSQGIRLPISPEYLSWLVSPSLAVAFEVIEKPAR